MKKIAFAMLIILITIIPYNNLALGENVSEIVCVAVNDDLVYFKDVYPEVKDGITFIPIRFFVQAMGSKVSWDDIDKKAIIEKEDKKIIIDFDKKNIDIGNGDIIYSDMFIKENRIMVPFRFISDFFGYEISFIEKENVVRATNVDVVLDEDQLMNKIKADVEKERNRIKEEIENKIKNIEKQIEKQKNQKIAYITFDDGPSKYTNDILNILDKYNSKATFFMLSNNINTYSESVKNIVEKGNAVGLHGVTHNAKKIYKSPSSLVGEMNEDNESLYSVTGMRSNLIRTPYGSKPYMKQAFRDAYVKAEYKMWDWNVDSKDSLKINITSNEIYENVKKQVKNQKIPIILLHERKPSVEALEKILYYLNKEGYTLVPISYDQSPVNFWNDTR